MKNRTFHQARVSSREFVNPGMVEIVLEGERLGDYPSTGIPDEFARLYFPSNDAGLIRHPDIPVALGQKRERSVGPCHSEVYTIRSFDRAKRELVIDFVVHKGGKASTWAQGARQGDPLVLSSPHGMYRPQKWKRKQLFLCDATGIPALARILETLPSETECLAIIEIADPTHRYEFQPSCRLETVWLERSGNGVAPGRLCEALHSLPPARLPDYVWMAGEHKQARAIRRHLRQQWQLPCERYAVAGYWIEKRAKWMAAWKDIEPALKRRIETSWSSGRDREEIRDEVDAMMEEAGL